MGTVRRAIVLSLVIAAYASSSGSPAVAQVNRNPKVQMPHYDEPGDLVGLPILGRWKINVDKSTRFSSGPA